MPRRTRIALAAVTTVALCSITGCSSGSSGWTKVALHDKTTTTVATGASGGPTTAADGQAPAPGGQAPAPTEGGSAPSGASATTQRPSVTLQLSGGYCDRVKQLSSESANLMDTDPNADPASQLTSLKKSFATVDDAYRQVQAKAPASIAADINTVVSAFHTANTKVQQLTSYDVTAISSIMQALQTSDLQASSSRIGSYTEKACGISTDSGSGSGSTN